MAFCTSVLEQLAAVTWACAAGASRSRRNGNPFCYFEHLIPILTRETALSAFSQDIMPGIDKGNPLY